MYLAVAFGIAAGLLMSTKDTVNRILLLTLLVLIALVATLPVVSGAACLDVTTAAVCSR